MSFNNNQKSFTTNNPMTITSAHTTQNNSIMSFYIKGTLATLLTIALCFTGNPLSAQEDKDEEKKEDTGTTITRETINLGGRTRKPRDPYKMKTLLGDKKIRHGGYLGFSMYGTSFDGDEGLLVGGRLAWIMNHHLAIGVSGFGLTSDITFDGLNLDRELYEFSFGYGGLLIEPIFFSKQPLHFTTPILIGAGGASFYNNIRYYDNVNDEWRNFNEEGDAFFVIEPGNEAELNIFKFMRLGAGASYRYLAGVDLAGLDSDQLNGFSVGLTLKMGIF